MTKIFEKSGSFGLNFKSDNFERQIKNYFIEFKYWDFGIRENEFLRSFRFYERKYIYRFGWRACRGQGEYIKYSYFETKIGQKLIKMIVTRSKFDIFYRLRNFRILSRTFHLGRTYSRYKWWPKKGQNELNRVNISSWDGINQIKTVFENVSVINSDTFHLFSK